MASVEAMPELVFEQVYNRLTRDGITLTPVAHKHIKYKLSIDETTKFLYRAKDALRLTHIGDTPQERVYNRYTNTGTFTPDQGDTVVDVGSFIGEFSERVAAKQDVSVVAVEPDPRNAQCTGENTPESVSVKQAGAYNTNDEIDFNIATDGSESGILTPDKGKSKVETVPVKRLDTLVDDADFVKVEAEGVEPEVLEGMEGLSPERIVVNVSPERDGKSPVVECRSILTERGYECRTDGDELFATQG